MQELKLATDSSSQRSLKAIKTIIDARIVQNCTHAGETVTAAVSYHLSGGGSRQRALLAYSTARALQIPHEMSVNIAACVEMLHNASLIHDDIQDKDMRRRGKAAVWVKYGKDVAICVGDALISGAITALAQNGSDRLATLIQLVNQRTHETIRGQVQDVNIKTGLTQARYTQIATEKAAPLIALAMELPAIAAGDKWLAQRLCKATRLFATAYQFSDDVKDADDDKRSGEPNIVNILVMESHHQLAERDAIETVKASIQSMLQEANDVLMDCNPSVREGLLLLIDKLQNTVEEL